MARKILLVGGVFSSLLYVIGIDVIVALRYPDYHNYADQMVSELFAVGAPTRILMVWLSIPYNVLVFALAVGVWVSAGRKRATRFTAAAPRAAADGSPGTPARKRPVTAASRLVRGSSPKRRSIEAGWS